jgi:hypothetical protein
MAPVLHSVLALLVLLAATVLGIYKPWGLTRFGRRKRRARRVRVADATAYAEDNDRPRLVRNLAVGLGIILLVLFIALHLLGRIPSH